MSNEALATIARIPFFSGVPESALEKLASVAHRRSFPKDAVFINEGDEAGALFIIVSGKAQAFLSNDAGKTVTLSTRESGSFFGELSLLDGRPRSASVITLEPTVCLLIPRIAFLQWLGEHPAAASNIICNLTAHIRTMTENIRMLTLTDM
jgi:CRP/FNR family cyclic AMP-dependent transcriptional regulator